MFISIHPQTHHGRKFKNGARVSFRSDRDTYKENSNSIEIIFASGEYHDKNKDPITPKSDFVVEDKISVFCLSDNDAEILSSIGRMNDEQREALLPAIREIMEAQKDG